MITSIMSICLVDTWEYFHEMTATDKAMSFESRVINFACELIEELCPSLNLLHTGTNLPKSMCHFFKLLPKTTTKYSGKSQFPLIGASICKHGW